MSDPSRNELLDLILSAIRSQTSSATLQDVTVNGNTTDQGIEILDNEGGRVGILDVDDFYGLVLSARDSLGDSVPITIGGSTTFIAAEQLAAVFNGAENGDFLRLTTKTDVNGQDAFLFGSVPLDVTQYTEQFTNGSPLTLSTSYQQVVNGVVVNEYRQDTSQAITTFRLENTSPTAQTVEFYITVNDAAAGVNDIQTATVPARRGVANGVFIVSFDDTSQASVSPADNVQVFAKNDGNAVLVASDIQSATLSMVQYADIQNLAQSSELLTSNGELSENRYYKVTGGNDYTLPDAGVRFSQSKPFGFFVENASGADITLTAFVGDSINTTSGSVGAITVRAGESYGLACNSLTTWGIFSAYQVTQAPLAKIKTKDLTTHSTNAHYLTDPQTVLDFDFTPTFSDGLVTVCFELESEATNAAAVAGIFIDDVLVDSEVKLEPKDARNTFWCSKTFDAAFTGLHNLKIKYGRERGGFLTEATIKNIRVYVEAE